MTKDEISKCFDEGVKERKAYMLIVCDTFSWEDYPVYIKSDKSFNRIYNSYDDKEMQRIHEVYDLKLEKKKQMADSAAFYPPQAWRNSL